MSTLPQPIETIPPPNPIRVETALSRYPLHRLAKHGDIAIDIRDTNDNGELFIKWEVTHNSKYGQPGPLAYKLDTLIINRRIEQAPRPLPKLLKLGSFREIIKETGLKNHDTDKVKKALRQNAFAAITAKIDYRLSDGTERTLEADFTRYSVILTGEKLPDGRKADAVYIMLNDIYMQVINGVMTRPLDYDYLKSLAPAPQRFYELLSFKMYAAIRNDRNRAKLLYSELCTYAPLVRQHNWNVVRPQLARIHAPHKKSGYIAKVDFERTVDAAGKPDWIMLYQPGPKARAEFRAFAKRGGPVTLEVEPLDVDLRGLASSLPPTGPAAPALVTELTDRGVTKTTAAELVQQHLTDRIAQKIEVFDWLVEKKDRRIARSPAGYLVKSITDDYAAPKGFLSRADREQREHTRKASEREAVEKRRQEREQEERDQAEQKAIAAYWDSLTPEQQAQLQSEADAQADPESLALEKGPLKRLARQIRRDEHIRQVLNCHEMVPADA
jgi:hypothetical protein